MLTGWGRTSRSAATVVSPEDEDAVARLLVDGRHRDGGVTAVVPRGLGRSYGDAAQCAGGLVVDCSRLDWIGAVDDVGVVEVGGGVRLGELIRTVLPQGWFVPVTPGTEHVTIGGAIAADVHGKNHHRDGSFCQHIRALTLSTPTGEHVTGPADDAELFWATAGGMGLTGVVVRARLQLMAVESPFMIVDTDRFDDLDTLMGEMVRSDMAHRYSVAWVDCTGGRGRRGRSVLLRGDHAAAGAVPSGRHRRTARSSRSRLAVPAEPPFGLITRTTTRAFNEAWFLRAPRHQQGAVQSLWQFFYPLDGIGGWNLLYGPQGFVQYQFVVDDNHDETVRKIVALVAERGLPVPVAVLKRFGPASGGPLSFPIEGWTLALDLPAGTPGLPTFLDHLDDLIATAGGRVYLAKDSRLRPELVPVMYPRLGDLARIRRRIDPDGLIASDLSRRLGIDPQEVR